MQIHERLDALPEAAYGHLSVRTMPRGDIALTLLSTKAHKRASEAVASQPVNTLPKLELLSKSEQRQVSRLPKASEIEAMRTASIRKHLGALGRQEFAVFSTTITAQPPASKLDLKTNITPLRPSTGSRIYDSIRRVGESITRRKMIGANSEGLCRETALPKVGRSTQALSADQPARNRPPSTSVIRAKESLSRLLPSPNSTRRTPTSVEIHLEARREAIKALRVQPADTAHRHDFSAFLSVSKNDSPD